jgi:D-3-phosphoglycerate dehydrogenase
MRGNRSSRKMARWQVFMTDSWDFMVPYDYEQLELSALACDLLIGGCRSGEEVIEFARGADILLNNNMPLERSVIEALPQCKMIVRYSVGVDTIDVDAATECGVIVANAPLYCVDEVSDHALALLLALARGIGPLDRGVRTSRWREWGPVISPPAHRLRTCVVGLIGLGHIGRAMAKKCRALGMRVLAFDPYVGEDVARRLDVQLVELGRVAREADFVSIHAPLLPGTRHLVGETLMRQMKATAFLINTSRGAIVDEMALCRALDEGWIAGAGLDVLTREPPDPANPLLQSDRVLLTPHFGSISPESTEDLRREVVEAVAALRSGSWPASVVNPQVKPRIVLHPSGESHGACKK